MRERDYCALLSAYNAGEQERIRAAFEFSSRIHEGQQRLSGEPFVAHPIAVSRKIIELELDADTVIAALLHDCMEDGLTTLKDICQRFGDDVAFLVNGVSKVERIHYRGIERATESIRKMFLAMAQDIRVVLIKLMDRMHNLETLGAMPEAKRRRIALESLELYAPLADRLGMGDLKAQIEDLAFRYAYPEECGWIVSATDKLIQQREQYLARLTPILKKRLARARIQPLDVHARVKHYYSVWKKLLRYDMDWGRIFDLVALRIVVPDVETCYRTLGVLHQYWRPLPGRIKDYIALPKSNGYQSLHTTVFGERGVVTEFQIRTLQMHRDAERGIAAHWAWEMAGKPRAVKPVRMRKFAWVEQMQRWQEEFYKNRVSRSDFLESLKIDFFKDRIFVLSPAGDVIDLPEHATPIDFAYHIHTDIGNHATGAKVNGKLVSFSHTLQSGDVVEIRTQKNRRPKREWLDFVQTNLAKKHIRAAVRLHSATYQAPKQIALELSVKNRIGLLKDIASLLSLHRINIQDITSHATKKNYPVITVAFTPKHIDQLEKIMTKLKTIRGIEEVAVKTTH